MEKEEWIMYEVRGLYDGWILKFKMSGEIEWRDFERAKNLSHYVKRGIEETVKDIIKQHNKGVTT